MFIAGTGQQSSVQSLGLSFWNTAPSLDQLLFHLVAAEGEEHLTKVGKARFKNTVTEYCLYHAYSVMFILSFFFMEF